MPYRSAKQRAFFHSAGATKAGISPATVAEWDQASKGMKLPETQRKKAKPKATRVRRR